MMENKRINTNESMIKLLWLLPIIVAIAIVPMIVVMKVVVLTDIEKVLWNNIDTTNDFFNKYKAETFIIAISIGSGITLLRLAVKDVSLRWNKWLIPIGLYALMITLSTFAMRYKVLFAKTYTNVISDPSEFTKGNIALRGFWDRYEGLYVLLGYVILTLIIYWTVTSVIEVDLLMKTLMASAFVISMIGIFQFFGHDFFQTKLGIKLMVPEMYASIRDQVKFNFGKFTSYSTLYNPNYVGGYMSVIFPIPLIYYFKSKRRVEVVMYGALTALIFGGLVASNSSTGLAALVASVFFIVVIGHKIFWRQKMKIASLTVVACALFLLLNVFSGSSLMNDFLRVQNTTTEVVEVDVNEPYIQPIGAKNELIKEIVKNDSGLDIITESVTVRAKLENGNLMFYNNEDKMLTLLADSEKMYFEDEGYEHIFFKMFPENQGFSIYIGNKNLSCYFLEDHIEMVGNGGRIFQPNQEVETFGFEGNEYFGSSRGYLWSRSIPIIKNTLLIGAGPDTFAATFPHYDYVGKANYLFSGSILPDKPHNMYIQMAINTGLVSLLAFLFIALGLLYKNTLSVLKSKNHTDKEMLQLAAAGSIVAYLVSGIGNDSVISITVIFWFIIAISMTLLEVNKKKA